MGDLQLKARFGKKCAKNDLHNYTSERRIYCHVDIIRFMSVSFISVRINNSKGRAVLNSFRVPNMKRDTGAPTDKTTESIL